MQNKILVSLLAILLTGCITNKPDFTSIEFMEYNWSKYNDTTRLQVPIFFKCRMFVKIDQSGSGQMYVYKSYPKPVSSYYSFTPNKTVIDNILFIASKPDTLKHDFDERMPIIYDGPSLKLLIKYPSNKTRLFDFVDSPRYEYQDLVQFYYYLDSIYLKGQVKKLRDTAEFDKIRIEFIKKSKIIDSNQHHWRPPDPDDSAVMKHFVPRVIVY